MSRSWAWYARELATLALIAAAILVFAKVIWS